MADIGINTRINFFKKNIANVISNSQLPVGVLYYVLKDVFKEIETLYENTLQKEADEIRKEAEKAEAEDIKENQE